uniref:Secreted protein n=1 Tax=Strongyloides papillosus TaxID=174720 RepID=A0A0N5C277_STREA
MKYFIAIFIAVIALRCYGGNYNRRNNPSYMSPTSSQEQDDKPNEGDDTNYQAKQKNSDYPNTQSRNYARQIDQVSDNLSLSRNDRRSQIRQVNSILIEDLLNEYDSFEDGRRNPMSKGDFVGRNNTDVRNFNNRRTRNI